MRESKETVDFMIWFISRAERRSATVIDYERRLRECAERLKSFKEKTLNPEVANRCQDTIDKIEKVLPR